MRRLRVILGVAVVIAGLFLILSHNMTKEVNSDQFVTAEDSWNISDTFQEGQELRLVVRPHPDWRLPFYFPEEVEGVTHAKILEVNITNTDVDTYTLLEIIYGFPPDYIPEEPYTTMIYPMAARVVHQGAITVKDPTDIGGIVEDGGVHTVKCQLIPDYVSDKDLDGNPWHHPASPPDLDLYKISSGTTYPYTYFLPLGVSLGVVGIATSIWGIKSRKQRTIRKSRLR